MFSNMYMNTKLSEENETQRAKRVEEGNNSPLYNYYH